MWTIKDNQGMGEYGVRLLTGEADRTAQRCLCDVDARGVRAVTDLLGVSALTLRPAWNGGGGFDWSIMVPHDLMDLLKAWLLIGAGADRVIVSGGGSAVGFAPGETAEFDRHLRHYEWAASVLGPFRVVRVDGGLPGEGTRCEHQMSGRIT